MPEPSLRKSYVVAETCTRLQRHGVCTVSESAADRSLVVGVGEAPNVFVRTGVYNVLFPRWRNKGSHWEDGCCRGGNSVRYSVQAKSESSAANLGVVAITNGVAIALRCRPTATSQRVAAIAFVMVFDRSVIVRTTGSLELKISGAATSVQWLQECIPMMRNNQCTFQWCCKRWDH